MASIFSIFNESTNSFEGQAEGENVVLLIRRHPFFIILKFIFYVIMIVIPLILALAFSDWLFMNSLLPLFLFILSLWYLFLWQTFFYSLTMYSLDVWIVTNQRIIDSTQHGFFNRTTSELHITRIQDISVKVDGAIQTFFHFGDMQVQTAGTEEKFKFIQIPNPEGVKDAIMKIAQSQKNI